MRVLLILIWLSAIPVDAYSVLTHEAIIDSAWDADIKPLLQKRFPDATADDLVKAHATAYGGCLLQDMGYYPFGSKFFSDLLHYVRSGDVVAALFEQSQTLEEYAFAFGALAHYAADINGHSVAVNRAVPLEYPELRRKYGDVVTYEQNPTAHLKTEFGFDVLQVAHGRYAPQAYHDFIGFQTDKGVLDRAFFEIYALHLKDVFASQALAFGTFRYSVSRVIPSATRVAWKLHSQEIVRDQPGMTRRRFFYNLSRSSYRKEWGRDYKGPGVGASVLAFFLRIMPKIGPFKAAAFKPPTPETARMFEDSFNRTLAAYRGWIRQAGAGHLQLTDLNLDNGEPVAAGKYKLADLAYAQLLQKLADRNFADVPEATRKNILAFYSTGQTPVAFSSKEAAEWTKALAALNKLKASE